MSIYEYLVSALKALAEHGIIIGATALSVTIAGVKSMKKHGKLDWMEALMCGCLTLAVSSALEYLKLPQQLAIFLGGLIGFKGSLWVDKFINRKIGLDEENK